MVDVAHDRDDRRARHQRVRRILEERLVDLLLGVLDRDLAAVLLADQADGVVGQRLRDGHELAEAHHRLDDLGRRDAQLLGQLLDGDARVDRDRPGRADDRPLLAIRALVSAPAALLALARRPGGLGVDDDAALLALRHAALRPAAADGSRRLGRERGAATGATAAAAAGRAVGARTAGRSVAAGRAVAARRAAGARAAGARCVGALAIGARGAVARRGAAAARPRARRADRGRGHAAAGSRPAARAAA